MATNYSKGRMYEYKLKNLLEELGFYVIRSAGSHGLFDLTAISKEVSYLIQVKKINDIRNIKHLVNSFKTEMNLRNILEKIPSSWDVVLAIWVKNKGWLFYSYKHDQLKTKLVKI